MMMILLLSLILTMMFMFMNHPMSMGLILLIQTILISILSGTMSYSFSFSYIIFLIMVWGMLVLFIYMTSLASNEMFQFSAKISLWTITFMTIIMKLLMMMPDNLMFWTMIKNTNLNDYINYSMFINNENLISLNKIYNSPNNIITILMINYLLITLIAVVKISSINAGPLRQKF